MGGIGAFGHQGMASPRTFCIFIDREMNGWIPVWDECRVPKHEILNVIFLLRIFIGSKDENGPCEIAFRFCLHFNPKCPVADASQG